MLQKCRHVATLVDMLQKWSTCCNNGQHVATMINILHTGRHVTTMINILQHWSTCCKNCRHVATMGNMLQQWLAYYYTFWHVATVKGYQSLLTNNQCVASWAQSCDLRITRKASWPLTQSGALFLVNPGMVFAVTQQWLTYYNTGRHVTTMVDML